MAPDTRGSELFYFGGATYRFLYDYVTPAGFLLFVPSVHFYRLLVAVC